MDEEVARASGRRRQDRRFDLEEVVRSSTSRISRSRDGAGSAISHRLAAQVERA